MRKATRQIAKRKHIQALAYNGSATERAHGKRKRIPTSALKSAKQRHGAGTTGRWKSFNSLNEPAEEN
jgi:hypothetical protein